MRIFLKDNENSLQKSGFRMTTELLMVGRPQVWDKALLSITIN